MRRFFCTLFMVALSACAEMLWDFSQDLPQNSHFIKAWASQIRDRKVVDGALQGVALKHPAYFSVYTFKKPVPLEIADLLAVEIKVSPGARDIQLYVNLNEPGQSFMDKKLITDGEYHTYVFDLTEMPNLKQHKYIRNIRINPITAWEGGTFAIKSIRLTGRNGFEPGVTAIIPKAPATLKVPHFFQLERGGKADAATSLELSYTDEGLRIQFSSELNNVSYHANAKKHDEAVFKDDCFDMALKFSDDSYYQIVFNPLGTVFDQHVTYAEFVPAGIKANSWLGHSDKSWNSTCAIDSKIEPGRWHGTFMIPWKDFSLTTSPKSFEMNIVRCSVADGKGDAGWNYSPLLRFAIPENMRRLTLGLRPSAVVTVSRPSEIYPGNNQLAFANPDGRNLECKAIVRDHSTGKDTPYAITGESKEITLNYELPEQSCNVLVSVRENGQMIFFDDFKVDGGAFRKRLGVVYEMIRKWPSTGAYAQIKPALEAKGKNLIEGKTKDFAVIQTYIAEVEKTSLELQQKRIHQETLRLFKRPSLPFAVASASSADKIFHSLEPGVPPFAGKPAASIAIESAANEIEGAQLVLLGMQEVKNLKLQIVQTPAGKVPQLSLYGVDFLDTRTVQETKYQVEFRGEWPDVLTPALPSHLAPGEVRSIWVKAETAADVPAGDYSWLLEISWDGMDAPLRVPLTVKVWDFALPTISKLRTACSTYEGFAHRYHQTFMSRKLTLDEKVQMTDRLVRFMLKNRMNPGYLYTMRAYSGQMIEYPDLNRLTEYRKLGLNAVPVGQMPQGNWSCTAEDMMKQYYQPERMSAFLETLRKTCELGRQQNLEQLFFLEVFDELFASKDKQGKIAALKDLVRQVRAIAPKMRLECSTYVEPELIGLIDLWVPSIKMMAAQTEEYRKRQEAGDEVWLYTCLGAPGHVPGEPPSFVLEESAAAMRLIGWICHFYKADGFLYYAMNHWHRNGKPGEKPYPDTPWNMQYVQAFNGEAALIYPGQGFVSLPLSSIRFENLRDGFEDFDYLKLLEERYHKKASSLTPAQKQEIKQLLSVKTLVRSGLDYTDDSAKITECRRQIALWIERLK